MARLRLTLQLLRCEIVGSSAWLLLQPDHFVASAVSPSTIPTATLDPTVAATPLTTSTLTATVAAAPFSTAALSTSIPAAPLASPALAHQLGNQWLDTESVDDHVPQEADRKF